MDVMKPNFNFKIIGDVFLSPEDLQVLSLLYQPIMRVDAFSLYITLLSLPKTTPKNHHLLLQLIGGDMLSLIDARERLEAMGLVDVYKDEAVATYFLKPPLSIKQFFNDAIMRAFLYVKIGAQDFNRLKQMLVTEDTWPVGEKVTKRFDEVFDVRPLSRFEQNLQMERSLVAKQGIEIAAAFDAEMLMKILLKKGISWEIISPEMIQVLNEFAFLYKYDVHELALLVFDASDPNGSVDMLKLKDLARKQYQLINRGERVQVVTKAQMTFGESNIQNSSAISEDDIISFLEQSPVEFLRFKSAGKPPVPADIRLVEWLYIDQKMPAGVVNVLVDYVLEHTGGSLPKQLIEKIAGQWQRQGIDTTEAAMNQVIATVTKGINYQKEKARPLGTLPAKQVKKAARIEPIPEWLGKEKSDLDSNEGVYKEEMDGAKARIEQMKQMMRSYSETGGGTDEKIK